MRRYLVLIMWFNSSLIAYNQVITGTILDQGTHDAVPYAAIYFSGTFAGTIADLDGNFRLDISKHASKPVTFSAMGYYSLTLNNLRTDQTAVIYLEPKVYEIEEVVVSTNSLARQRERNLRTFRLEFLGTSYNARKCEILNEEDITFNYDSDRDTLKAYALKPLLISNHALGYNITYYLDQFQYIRRSKTIYFEGDILFNQDLADAETDLRTCERRRRYAYSGSCLHFFRALWADELEFNNFRIKIPGGADLSCEDVVTEEDRGTKYLRYAEALEIWYHSGDSYMEFLKEKVYFDQSGFFDPAGILWRGPMGRKRIADWLPYEYAVGD